MVGIEKKDAQPNSGIVTTSDEDVDQIDEFLRFEAEKDPAVFTLESSAEQASGTFSALVTTISQIKDPNESSWDFDFSNSGISGDGFDKNIITPNKKINEQYEFLRVRNSGRKSIRRAIVQSGTQLDISVEDCVDFVNETVFKGWTSFADIDRLVSTCKGNGDQKELCTNLQHLLEYAGYNLGDQFGRGIWDNLLVASANDLAEAIEAALTRATPLPGMERFLVEKNREQQLLAPLIRSKKELQIKILGCEAAVQKIIDVFEGNKIGAWEPTSDSIKNINLTRPNYGEMEPIVGAIEILKNWKASGRAMDGRRRREVLAALETLDLSIAFQRQLVRWIEQIPLHQEVARELDILLSLFENAIERLICEHLPYARRFSSRYVKDGEDPEELFQVAFLGLQRSTQRFNLESGHRFIVYATYWMWQAITRWRADEGGLIRVPAHRFEKLSKIDPLLDKYDIWFNQTISDDELAKELEWTRDEVFQIRNIPRKPEFPDSDDEWDLLIKNCENVDVIEQMQTEQIVKDAIASLPERQADVIRMRFGIERDGAMTLEEVGQLYGVTRERIRQIEAKAIRSLRLPNKLGKFTFLLEN